MSKHKEMTGAEFLAVREKTGLNQKDFGVALGFTPDGAQRTVSALENGGRPIKATVANLVRYVKKYGFLKR